MMKYAPPYTSLNFGANSLKWYAMGTATLISSIMKVKRVDLLCGLQMVIFRRLTLAVASKIGNDSGGVEME